MVTEIVGHGYGIGPKKLFIKLLLFVFIYIRLQDKFEFNLTPRHSINKHNDANGAKCGILHVCDDHTIGLS